MKNNTLYIRTLGEFSLSYGEKTIRFQDGRSRKIGTLLAYTIMFRNREITQAEFIDLLWGDEDSNNPANALKTMFHRLRASLNDLEFVSGHEMILSRKGSYSWNNSLNISMDIDEFEHACEQGKSAGTDAERLQCYRQAVSLYHGDFLPLYNTEPWVMSISVYYHMMYINTVQELIQLLYKENCLEETVGLCRRAIEIDPYEESLYYHQIKALLAAGNQQAALSQYENMKELFFSKFGVTPSDELQSLYRDVVVSTNSMQMDLNLIRSQLKEQEEKAGAFFCEYEFFKDVYRIQARSIIRDGSITHLGLLTVSDYHGQKVNQSSLNLIMDKLWNVINSCLRRGDVFAKYSVSQYIIMMQNASYESSKMVMERITKRFRREHPHAAARLSFSVQPLEPNVEIVYK